MLGLGAPSLGLASLHWSMSEAKVPDEHIALTPQRMRTSPFKAAPLTTHSARDAANDSSHALVVLDRAQVADAEYQWHVKVQLVSPDATARGDKAPASLPKVSPPPRKIDEAD